MVLLRDQMQLRLESIRVKLGVLLNRHWRIFLLILKDPRGGLNVGYTHRKLKTYEILAGRRCLFLNGGVMNHGERRPDLVYNRPYCFVTIKTPSDAHRQNSSAWYLEPAYGGFSIFATKSIGRNINPYKVICRVCIMRPDVLLLIRSEFLSHAKT